MDPEESGFHPLLEDEATLWSLRGTAKQLLREHGIEIGGEQYRAYWKAYNQTGLEFIKASVLRQGLFPNHEFPDLSEADLDPTLLQDYPLIAAVALVEHANSFEQTIGTLIKGQTVSLVQCHAYAMDYWRLTWLAQVLKIPVAFEAYAKRRQRELARKPRASRRNELREVVVDILRHHPTFSEKRVRRELELRAGTDGIIQTVTDTHIEWVRENGEVKQSPITALKDLVHKGKQQIAGRDSPLAG